MTHVVVYGDALLDVDLVGQAQRLTPDAPVPVLDDVSEHPRPGGAALAAYLAAAHGADVTLVAPWPDDEPAARLRELLEPHVRLCPLPCDGATAVKQRVRAGGQSVVRLDSGGRPARVGELTSTAAEALSTADGVLVSDYGRGATAVARTRRFLATLPQRRPVVWDPHPRGAPPPPGLHLITPNAEEAATWARRCGADAVGPAPGGFADAAEQAATLVRCWQAGAVAVTLGARGALLSHGHGAPVVLPAPPAAGVDACGAGDALAAAAAVSLASGHVTGEAVQSAVEAASRFVQAGGAAAVMSAPPAAARQSATMPGVASPGRRDARTLATQVRDRGGVLVATGGCFDLLHAGHIACLQAARRLGDALIVCLNSDASVRRLKGPSRPVVPADDRARVLLALECVDSVEIFDDDTPGDVLRTLRPHVWAKGGDYAGADLPEASVMAEWGGQAVTLPYVNGRSTTALVRAAARSTASGPRPA